MRISNPWIFTPTFNSMSFNNTSLLAQIGQPQSQFMLANPALVAVPNALTMPLFYSFEPSAKTDSTLSELDIFLDAHPEIQEVQTEDGFLGFEIPNVGLIVLEEGSEPSVVNEGGMDGLKFKNIDRLHSDFAIGRFVTKTEINSLSQIGVWFPENLSNETSQTEIWVSVTNADVIFITDHEHPQDNHHDSYPQIQAHVKAEPNAKLYFTFYESGHVREILTWKPSANYSQIQAGSAIIYPKPLTLFNITLSDEDRPYIRSASYALDENKSQFRHSDDTGFFNTLRYGFVQHSCEPSKHP